MVPPLHASKFPLPPSLSSSSSPAVSSLLFDPHSLSLSLSHSDSSLSLYPSLSSPLSSLPTPQTLIPPPSSSHTFLLLQNPNNPNNPTTTLFLVSSPLLAGSALLLRFYTLLKPTSRFANSRVVCNQTGLEFDENRSGVVFNVNHGVSIKLVGSVNVFAMYSVSNGKIWVFAVKMMDDEVTLKLMKCAVIDCCVPVFAVSVSFGYLMLGEENGVRVFALRPLVKGRVKRHRGEGRDLNEGLNNGKLEGQRLNSPNGVHQTIRRNEGQGSLEISCNGYIEGKSDKHFDTVKLKSVKLRQDSNRGSSCFVAFKNKEVNSDKLINVPLQSAKAISIQALSPNKFLILDSDGQLHLLCVSLPVVGSQIHCHVKQLTNTMKVEKLAVLPDLSTRTQTVWISDGCHTLHMLALSDMDASVGDSDNKDSEEKLVGISVIQAIIASEKIQDVIPLATNAILLLGEGHLSRPVYFVLFLLRGFRDQKFCRGTCHSSHELQLSLVLCGVCDSKDTELLKRKQSHGDRLDMPSPDFRTAGKNGSFNKFSHSLGLLA